MQSIPRRLFYMDRYLTLLPEGHKFPSRKYGILRGFLAEDPGYQLRPAPLADQRTIELAHEPLYVKQFLKGELPVAGHAPQRLSLVGATPASLAGIRGRDGNRVIAVIG